MQKVSVFIRYFLVTVFLLLVLIPVRATNYYFSNTSGNDGYTSTQAQNPSTPWKSIAKLNSFFNSLNAGDKVFFKRGDIFYGSIVFSKSGTNGAPIVLDAYGIGDKPVITGLITLSAWTSLGGGVFQASAPSVKNNVNLVTLNGKPQQVGRYPNADAANSGYLTYETWNGTTSITDNQLTNGNNWTGAEVVIRKQHYLLERCKINNHSGTTISYSSTPVINPSNGGARIEDGINGFGYFIQRDVRTLDQLGEWYFDPAQKNMKMYFGSNNPSSYNLQVSSIDTIININNNRYIDILNLNLEGGNTFGIYGKDGGNINVINCDANSIGARGIFLFNCPNVVVDNLNSNYVASNAIDIQNRTTNNVTIRNCNINNTGTVGGMGSFWDNADYKGVFIEVKSTALLEYNNIGRTGYTGLHFQGNDIMVKNNFVNYFNFVTEDGGGIYTYTTNSEYYTNRVIKDNIVINGIGATDGTGGDLNVNGIYLDGSTMNVDVLNNSVANVGVNAFFCNNPTNVKIQGNTSFNNGSCVGLTQYHDGPIINNFRITNNVFYPKTESQFNFFYANTGLDIPSPKTIETAMQQIGFIDNNYCNFPNTTGYGYYYKVNGGGSYTFPSPLSFESWKSASNHDLASALPPKTLPSYTLNKLIGPNKIVNGQFNSDISSTNFFSDIANNTSSWDNTGKLGSGGSLKLTPSKSASNFTFIYKTIGAITANKKYIVRFSTVGSGNFNVVNALIRQTQVPYNYISNIPSHTFGTSKTDHEFLLTAKNSETDASLQIEIQQLSGATYIDNIEFYEADATPIDIDSQLRFEYNPTRNTQDISLDGNYIGVDGTKYSGSISLLPYTSKVLIKDTGSIAPVAPPVIAPSTLKATVSANAINCFGGSTTATVSATGGNSPYSSTGNFPASAGVGSLKISFPSTVTNEYSSLIGTIGAVSSSKNYVVRFSTLGTSSQGFLRVYLGQDDSPYGRLSSTLPSATFGTARVDHQFIFNAPTSDATANVVIEISQGSGTTYIDNIAVFESTSTGDLIGNNLLRGGQFETDVNNIRSWSPNNNQSVNWDNTSKINNVYYYTVYDAMGATSTAILNTSQASAPLQASATPGIISVIGGTTTVTVSASGGTAPYTGVGSFTGVKAGNYSYTVTDANGCSASTNINVIEKINGIDNTTLVSSAAATKINCYGGSCSVTVSATGGTAPYSSVGTYTATAGIGSLKISFPNNASTVFSSIFGAIGSVSSSKSYTVRFSTLGTTSQGFLRVYLGQNGSNYARISGLPSAPFGTSRVDHEFTITGPSSEASANLVIEVQQNSGTTYIDNIAVFEVSATGTLIGGNKFSNGQFETDINNVRGWSPNNNQVVTWDNSRKINSVYYYTVYDLPGFTSTSIVNIQQPAAPLQAFSSAPAITTDGGTTNVTVTAIGGTPPYTGTGTFSVTAGTYTYTIRDANFCTVSTTVSTGQVFARSATPSQQAGSITNNNLFSVSSPLSITTFPNPTNTEFGLMVEGGSNEKIEIVVRSVDGRTVFKTVGNSNQKYNFGDTFLPGLYLIQVIQGTETKVLKAIKLRGN